MSSFLPSRALDFRDENPRFAPVFTERQFADRILDKLVEEKRDNKNFLDGWIDYHYRKNLRGVKVEAIEKTSLPVFARTLRDYMLVHRSS